MLHHVCAEEIRIAQVVDRTIERSEHQQQAGEEKASLGDTRFALQRFIRPDVRRAEGCNSDGGTRVDRPSPPTEIGDGMQQRQEQHVT